MGVYSGPEIVNNGLILQLDASNSKSYSGSGTIWGDLSGNARNSTLLNSLTYTSNEFTFDGIDDYVNTGFDLSWNNTNSVTIMTAVKPASLSIYYPFMGKGPNNWEWQILQNNTALSFVYWNTSGGHTNGPVVTISNFFLNITDYVHIAIVWNHIDNKYYFYRNSVLVNTTNWVDASINQNRTDPVHVGGNLYLWSASSRYWNGKINFVSVYNRALTNTEIKQNFEAMRGRYGI